MSLLDVRKLRIAYDDDLVVDGLSFSIEAGESVGLVGESGSGKTQTALALLGLLPDTATAGGSIRFDGRELLGARETELDRLRAVRLSMVFQDPARALNPYLRIGDQLRHILVAHGICAGRVATARAVEMLDRVGLPDAKRQSRAFAHQLSGGMRQRAMIAAALIAGPDLLVADEPTTALDVTVQAQILELLEEIRDDTALLLITHDLGVVAGHCERMLVIKEGRLLESGTTRAVFEAPETPYTAALIAAAPRLATGAGDSAGALLVSAAGVCVSYPETRRRRLEAVKNVDLSIKTAETVAIVGESGSGKSSLARALLGLEVAHSGTFRLRGARLAADLGERPRATRRELQLVFQDPQTSLNPQMRVGRIVSEPLAVHEPELDRRAANERVERMLDLVGLGTGFLHRYPHELSGGEAQRVAIARALINEPSLLVCDEALAALDGTVRAQILSLLRDIQRRTQLSMLFISHDLGIVSSISHRVFVMYLGRVVESAASRSIFERPRHPYTRALIDAVPVPDPGRLPRRKPLPGDAPSILSPPPGCPFHPRCAFAEARCAVEFPEQLDIESTTVSCLRAREIDLRNGESVL